ncbi:hypothetical protein ExPUPEC61_00460 [Escherichia coli]|nr:hypothetical protein ExPUPEC61_00460 [Escherichia coli]
MLCEGNFVLIVLVAGALGFDVVVADFHHGAHDWRPLVHRANTDGPPLGAVVVIPVDILVHTHVHHVPVVAHGDRTVVEDTQHVTVVIDIVGKFFVIKRDARTLRQTFTLRGHRVSSVLNNKLVKTLQDTLSMFSSE